MIIRRGTYSGLSWFQSINEMGGKCAYVAIPIDRFDEVFKTNAKFDKKLFSSLNYPSDIDNLDGIHGGCTYFSRHLPMQECKLAEDSVVIGWDYCHFDDINMIFDVKHFLGHEWFNCRQTDEQIQNDIRSMIDSFISFEHHSK